MLHRRSGSCHHLGSACAYAWPRSVPPPEDNAANEANHERPARAQVASATRSTRRAVVEPLSAARYRIQLNASAELKQKLEHALDLLSHSNPSGDLSLVIERALDLLIERVEKKRFAQTRSPRRGPDSDAEKSERSAKSTAFRAHIRNETKRQITARDGLRCTFVASDGQRCTASSRTTVSSKAPRRSA